MLQKKNSQFGNIFCKKVTAPRFFDMYVCTYVCMVMNNMAQSEATLK